MMMPPLTSSDYSITSATTNATSNWKPAPSPLLSIFASDVSPNNMTTPYPRPQMQRSQQDSWISLNGLWDFGYRGSDNGEEIVNTTILVPFPMESPLSGIRHEPPMDGSHVWYHKTLDSANTPEVMKFLNSCGSSSAGGKKENRTLLHVEASDWNTTIFINDEMVGPGSHLGGYDPFWYGVTDYLFNEKNEIFIEVVDPTQLGTANGLGKQNSKKLKDPGGIVYSSTTGIWGSVWFECVPSPIFIQDLWIQTPNNNTISIQIDLYSVVDNNVEVDNSTSSSNSNEQQKLGLKAILYDAAETGGSQQTVVCETSSTDNISAPLVLHPPPLSSNHQQQSFRLWSPEDPYLYSLTIQLFNHGDDQQQLLDEISSYVGVRTIQLSSSDPTASPPTTNAMNSSHSTQSPQPPHLLLNGKPIFQIGVLDQGFTPDGNYAYATDDAIQFDLKASRHSLGFNTIRKHVKMESRRWYYHTDRLGILVWQDLPSRGNFLLPKEEQQEHESSIPQDDDFEIWLQEQSRNIKARRNSPSIIQWIAFNEGWGQQLSGGEREQMDDQHHISNNITLRTVERIRQLDNSTRLITDASGGRDVCLNSTSNDYMFWRGGCYGNVTDVHAYVKPKDIVSRLVNATTIHNKNNTDPNTTTKALVLGEFGGALLIPLGHEWVPTKCHGYYGSAFQNRHQLEELYDQYADQLIMATNQLGLSAAIYTQITDVETECNGLLTYDRIFKVNPERIATANARIINNFQNQFHHHRQQQQPQQQSGARGENEELLAEAEKL